MCSEEQVPMGTADRVSRLERQVDELKAVANGNYSSIALLSRLICRMYDRADISREMNDLRNELHSDGIYDWHGPAIPDLPFPSVSARNEDGSITMREVKCLGCGKATLCLASEGDVYCQDCSPIEGKNCAAKDSD